MLEVFGGERALHVEREVERRAFGEVARRRERVREVDVVDATAEHFVLQVRRGGRDEGSGQAGRARRTKCHPPLRRHL